MIIVRTPMRVSLFGGGTDYPGYFRQRGGAVLGMAIDKYCWITLRRLPPFFSHRHRVVYSKVETVNSASEVEHPVVRQVLKEWDQDYGLEIHHDADLPARSGMGTSSSFTVGLINALETIRGRLVTRDDLAVRAIDMEQAKLKENVGCQDQIWAAHGGMNRIDFHCDGSWTVRPLIMDSNRRQELIGSIALYFTGLSRYASEVAAEQVQRIPVSEVALDAMHEMVNEASKILCSEKPLSHLGDLLNDSWALKRQLSPHVTTPEAERLIDAGLRAGAWGAKLLGAGGGGFLLFLVPFSRRESLREAMEGRIEISVNPDWDGSRVLLYQPNGW